MRAWTRQPVPGTSGATASVQSLCGACGKERRAAGCLHAWDGGFLKLVTISELPAHPPEKNSREKKQMERVLLFSQGPLFSILVPPTD